MTFRRELFYLLCVTVALAFAVAALALERFSGGYSAGILPVVAAVLGPLLLIVLGLFGWVSRWAADYDAEAPGAARAPREPVAAAAPVALAEADLERWERWERALEGVGYGVWSLNPATGGIAFSPAWRRLFGYSAAEAPTTLAGWRALVHPEDQTAMRLAFEDLLRGKSDACRVTYRMRDREGEYRWVQTSGQALCDEQGRPRRVIGANADIGALRNAEERLAQLSSADAAPAERSLREAAAVFAVSEQAIMFTDTDGTIRRVNPAFVHMTGYEETEAVGQTPRLLKSGRQDEAFYKSMWERLIEQGRWDGEVWNRRKNGSVFPAHQIVLAVRDAAGKPLGYAALMADMTQQKRDEGEIAFRANYDALTGLPNRNLLAERLKQALKEGKRENSRIAVMFVDLDFFKQVNDTLGHAVGDRLLQLVAERMRMCVRETDTIARLGGDEFVILLPDMDAATQAGIVAEKMIAQLVEPFVIEGNEIHIGASAGITIYPDDGHDVDTLFRNADLAMYRAKSVGRNNAQFFESALTTAAIDRRVLENDMRGALLRREFRLHFLPQVDMATRRITGVEALLRWQHPQRGLLSPDKFVPLAEETGLIRDIGAWALEESCRQVARWEAAGHALTLAINISIRQLPDALAVDAILAVLSRYRIAPHRLILEITESVLRAEAPAIQKWFVDAGAAGLHLTIDDFGSGYSSLVNLKRFPVRHVKIDRSFVKDMAGNAGHRSLVEAILALAHSLGLTVVAEGVETVGQASLLREHACEHAQGYLYSQPLPADELLGLLDKSAA